MQFSAMRHLGAKTTADQPGERLGHGVPRLPFAPVEVFSWPHCLSCAQPERPHSRRERTRVSRDFQKVYRAFMDPALDLLRGLEGAQALASCSRLRHLACQTQATRVRKLLQLDCRAVRYCSRRLHHWRAQTPTSLVEPPGDRMPHDSALVQNHRGQNIGRSHGLEAQTHALKLLLTPILCRGVVKRQPPNTQTAIVTCRCRLDNGDDLANRAVLPSPVLDIGLSCSRAARVLGHRARRASFTVTVVTQLQGKWLIQLLCLFRDAYDILHVNLLRYGAIRTLQAQAIAAASNHDARVGERFLPRSSPPNRLRPRVAEDDAVALFERLLLPPPIGQLGPPIRCRC
eukprot:15472230-Alexandrium_andersonii.AAC.1